MSLDKKDHLKKESNNLIYHTLETIKEMISQAQHKKINLFHKFAKEIEEGIIKTQKVPHIKNVFSFVFSEKPFELKAAKELFVRKCNIAQIMLRQNHEKTIDFIANKIKNNSRILAHGNNFELFSAIQKASADGKKVTLFVVDSPFSDLGKEYSKLTKLNVSLKFCPFAALRQVLKQVDFVIISAEAITQNKIISEMGSELIAEQAHKKNIPLYVVSSAWNFHKEFEISSLNTIKKNYLEGTHSFFEHKFEQISPVLISGIISEKGNYNHNAFVNLIEK